MRYTEKIKKPLKLRKEKNFDEWMTSSSGSFNNNFDYSDYRTEVYPVEKPEISKVIAALDACENILKDLSLFNKVNDPTSYVDNVFYVYKEKFTLLRKEISKLLAG